MGTCTRMCIGTYIHIYILIPLHRSYNLKRNAVIIEGCQPLDARNAYSETNVHSLREFYYKGNKSLRIVSVTSPKKK